MGAKNLASIFIQHVLPKLAVRVNFWLVSTDYSNKQFGGIRTF